MIYVVLDRRVYSYRLKDHGGIKTLVNDALNGRGSLRIDTMLGDSLAFHWGFMNGSANDVGVAHSLSSPVVPKKSC